MTFGEQDQFKKVWDGFGFCKKFSKIKLIHLTFHKITETLWSRSNYYLRFKVVFLLAVHHCRFVKEYLMSFQPTFSHTH